jgi:hypothetical protein
MLQDCFGDRASGSDEQVLILSRPSATGYAINYAHQSPSKRWLGPACKTFLANTVGGQ